MHTFMDNFHQGGEYTAQIVSHQEELNREENFTDQKYLSISFLQTDDINIYSSSSFGRNSERANTVQTKCNWVDVLITLQKHIFKSTRKEKEKARADGDLGKQTNGMYASEIF